MHRLRLLRALIWHLFPWALWTTARQAFAPPIPPRVVVEIPPRHAGTFNTEVAMGFSGIDRTVLDGPALASFRAGMDRAPAPPLTLEEARRIPRAGGASQSEAAVSGVYVDCGNGGYWVQGWTSLWDAIWETVAYAILFDRGMGRCPCGCTVDVCAYCAHGH